MSLERFSEGWNAIVAEESHDVCYEGHLGSVSQLNLSLLGNAPICSACLSLAVLPPFFDLSDPFPLLQQQDISHQSSFFLTHRRSLLHHVLGIA
jgi:hypothetical protein